jgi:Domain of unknown function (DUF4440)
MKSYTVVGVLALAGLLNVGPVVAAEQGAACQAEGSAKASIVKAVESLFEAAGKNDLATFQTVVVPEFYIYDGGVRFTAESLVGLIQKAQASGTSFEWNVTEPKIHVSCNTAWITYVNKGSITTAAGRQEMKWLESANLEYLDGAWKIDFVHSTRAPKAP